MDEIREYIQYDLLCPYQIHVKEMEGDQGKVSSHEEHEGTKFQEGWEETQGKEELDICHSPSRDAGEPDPKWFHRKPHEEGLQLEELDSRSELKENS